MKPGNILVELDSEGHIDNAVVTDFGLGAFIEENKRRVEHTAKMGTECYMAPEVRGGEYDELVDIFSLGVLLLICGVGQKDAAMFDKTFHCQENKASNRGAFAKAFADKFSVGNASLVEKMISERADFRPSASAILVHPWLASLSARPTVENTTTTAEVERLHTDMAQLRLELEQESEEKSQLQGHLSQAKQESDQHKAMLNARDDEIMMLRNQQIKQAIGRNAGANNDENGIIDADENGAKVSSRSLVTCKVASPVYPCVLFTFGSAFLLITDTFTAPRTG